MSVFTRDGDAVRPDRARARARGIPTRCTAARRRRCSRARSSASRPSMRVARLTSSSSAPVPLAPLTRRRARSPGPGRRFQVAEATLVGRRPRGRAARARVAPARAATCRRPARPTTGRRSTRRPRRPSSARTSGLGGEGVRRDRDGHPLRRRARSTRPGPATAWFRLERPLVEGEEPTPAQRAVAAADFGNGISRVLDWNEWLFVNTDLTVHLHREPEGEWVGARRAHRRSSPTAPASRRRRCTTARGPIGVAAQTLFVDRARLA